MFAILYWEDSTFTVIAVSTIVSPRKEIDEYVVGEEVKAKFRGKMYSAHIYEISDDRSVLNQKLKSGMKIDLKRLHVVDDSPPGPAPIVPSEPSPKKRHKSAEDAPVSKPPTVRKRRKTADVPVPEPTRELQRDHLVEQAMAILQKRREKAPNVSTPIDDTASGTAMTTCPDRILPTTPTPIEPTPIQPATPNLVATPFPVTTFQEHLTPIRSADQLPSPFTTPTVQEVTSVPTSLIATTTSPLSAYDYQDSWHYEEPVINEFGFLPTAPAKSQAVDNSYMSMLNSSLEDTQVNHAACSQMISKLEQRVAELEAWKAKTMEGMSKRVETPSPPLRTPLMPRTLLSSSNFQQKENVCMARPTSNSESSTKVVIADTITYETRLPRAISKAMKAVFTNQQLATCSFKGGVTGKGEIRPSLPEAERDSIIDAVSRQFGVDASTVEAKMRSALRRFYLMYRLV